MAILVKSSVLIAITFAFLVQPTPRPSLVTQVPSTGEITGKVVDAQGRPIADVRVMAEVPGTPSVTVPQTNTDANGNFRIENLLPALYTLHTMKEVEGYARSDYDLYREGINDETTIRVYADEVTPNIVIQLQKAAVLKGRVVDGSTGKPIEHFGVILAQVADPKRFLQMGAIKGEFRAVVPALPITVRVFASGYEEWRYKTDRDDSLFLAAGTTRELNVVMRPSKEASTH